MGLQGAESDRTAGRDDAPLAPGQFACLSRRSLCVLSQPPQTNFASGRRAGSGQDGTPRVQSREAGLASAPRHHAALAGDSRKAPKAEPAVCCSAASGGPAASGGTAASSSSGLARGLVSAAPQLDPWNYLQWGAGLLQRFVAHIQPVSPGTAATLLTFEPWRPPLATHREEIWESEYSPEALRVIAERQQQRAAAAASAASAEVAARKGVEAPKERRLRLDAAALEGFTDAERRGLPHCMAKFRGKDAGGHGQEDGQAGRHGRQLWDPCTVL